MAAPFERIAIIGTGLIGTSLALALKSQRNPARISGFDLNGDSRRGANGAKTASGQKAFDKVVGSFREAVRGADLVVVATPVQGLEVAFQELAVTVGPGTIVTDTAGTKEKALA